MDQPPTKYARSGELSIAYQVLGDGHMDVVHVPGFVSNLTERWEDPAALKFFSRIASYARLVLFDKRGTGLSDPAASAPTLEDRIDDMRAVMDAVGSERAALFGISDGGFMSLLYAATHPRRVTHLVLSGTAPRLLSAPNYPFRVDEESFGPALVWVLRRRTRRITKFESRPIRPTRADPSARVSAPRAFRRPGA